MKNLRNLMATITLMAILMIGASTAKAGFLVSDFAQRDNTNPCNEKSYKGILITDLTGILITDLTGILITDLTDSQTNCGILITD